MDQLSEERWVADQYSNAANLNARIQLHERFGTNPYPWQRWVFDQFSFAPVSHLLEVGCGPGTLWRENSDRVALRATKAAQRATKVVDDSPAQWSLLLTDLSPGMVRQAQHNLQSVHGGLRFGVCDTQALPFVESSFDGVIANHMLYHVPDLGLALSEIRRVLRPGGRLFAATNGAQHMRQFRQLAQRIAAEQGAEEDVWPQNQFAFDSGKEELSAYFAQVKLHRYEGVLAVTEVEPLVAYAISMGGIRAGDARVAAFRAAAEQEIGEKGLFEITTETGLFEATCGE